MSRSLKCVFVLALTLAGCAYAEDPVDGSGWFRLGMTRHAGQDETGALAALERAWAMHFAPSVTAYNLAAIHALIGHVDDAFTWLGRAVTAGFRDANGLQHDEDFAMLRRDPRFAEVIADVDRRAHPCRGAGHHALDFWIGEWEVRDTASGKPVGSSSVQGILDGCVVLENWTGRFGMTGKSFNSFDPNTRRWKQSWVDSTAQAYEFTGDASNGGIVYLRDVVNAQGKPAKNRMTLSKREDGGVHQLSETSDDGKSWTTAYDFTYVRQPSRSVG